MRYKSIGWMGKCTGIIGEYIGAIHTRVLKRPLVIEKERINFDYKQRGNPVRELYVQLFPQRL